MAPTALAKMQLRSQTIDELKTAMPPPGSPRTASSPTSQPSRITSLIGDVRSPIFESGCPTERPRVPFSTRKPVMPAKPSERSIVANTT